ncbi:MAG: DegT/DnrJ/EryC1/StrS family aminotransferase [Paracoccaceae bacterium]
MAAVPVPLFDPRAQYARLRSRIDERMRAVLEHGRYVLGPEVTELEHALARVADADHVVTVGNGTDALTIALMAEGIGPGDAVFVPSLTFVATAGAVIAAGATPVFCDVDRSTFTLDPEDLARRAAQLRGGLKARAVIPVDLFGQPADYPALSDVAQAFGLRIVADAAQSMGGALGGRPVGGLAPVTATSFYPTKPIGALGDGGALFTGDAECASRMKAIRAHGDERMDGLNSRLDTLQAAVLLVKLEVMEADRARRSDIAAHYDAALSDHVGLQVRPAEALTARAVYAILSDRRETIRAVLAERGISSRAYYATPLHLMASMRTHSDGPGSLPVTEALSERLLALPLHADLSDGDVDRVCEAVLAALHEPPAAARDAAASR